MKQPIQNVLILFLLTALTTTHASAFQTLSPLRTTTGQSLLTTTNNNDLRKTMKHNQHVPVLRLRGGGSDATEKAAAPPKKIRIAAFDSMRFFLILNIVLGHFGRFANPSEKLLTVFSQHNVIVGAFFALSGYVTVRPARETFVCDKGTAGYIWFGFGRVVSYFISLYSLVHLISLTGLHDN